MDRLLDERYMQMALGEAEAAFDNGEVPIGCVIVRDGKIIARGSNQMEALQDPTAHAEILAIGAASAKGEGNWRLDDTTLYVTLEPCPMCAGAILNSRVSRVVFGAPDKRLGACGSTMDILKNNPIHREIEVLGGVLADQCLGIIQQFFQVLRARKKEEKSQVQVIPLKGVSLI
jgi:tRNA(adenine34) deaminase